MELKVVELNIHDFAESIKTNFKHVTQNKGLELYIHKDEKCPATILTDQKRMAQIIRNLMANAVKFTEKGSIAVNFGPPERNADLSEYGLAPEMTIAISIMDTGIGIPQEKQKLIFEAFRQAEGGISRQYGGTGLGLSISRELSTLLGGGIQLISQPGKGSTFTSFLPVEGPAERHASSKPPSRIPSHHRHDSTSVASPIAIDSIPDDRDSVEEVAKQCL